jgi:hypothetical protein
MYRKEGWWNIPDINVKSIKRRLSNGGASQTRFQRCQTKKKLFLMDVRLDVKPNERCKQWPALKLALRHSRTRDNKPGEIHRLPTVSHYTRNYIKIDISPNVIHYPPKKRNKNFRQNKNSPSLKENDSGVFIKSRQEAALRAGARREKKNTPFYILQ